MQQTAKNTIEYIINYIRPGVNLLDIRNLCEEKMLSLGADSFWYYNIGAFVFSGKDTVLSVSGREYKTADKMIENNDIITIDLSPQCNYIWGDYARTVVIENRKVVKNIENICNTEWKDGLLMEENLHRILQQIASPETTFEELFFYINKIIAENGYENLDYLGNLGHSIEKTKDERI